MIVQILVKIHPFVNILSGNKILTAYKGGNSVTNWWKWTINNPKLDAVNINASAKGEGSWTTQIGLVNQEKNKVNK